MALQLPWGFVMLGIAAWLDARGFVVLAALPTVVALPLGVYSVWTAGIRRNLYGVSSLAIIALFAVSAARFYGH
jgi:hypothetical protein